MKSVVAVQSFRIHKKAEAEIEDVVSTLAISHSQPLRNFAGLQNFVAYEISQGCEISCKLS